MRFKANLLLKKTHHLQFSTTNHDELDMHISFSHKQHVNSSCTKFLGLNTDNKLSWKNHIDYLVTNLSSSCFIMRTIKPIMSQKSLRMIYFAYVHSIMTYGIIFWGNSPYSIKIFRIQKKVVRIVWRKEIHAGIHSKKWKFCLYVLNTYIPWCNML
jgi:hypothetical protein